MAEQLSLVPNARGMRHVRAGKVLRVSTSHLVPTHGPVELPAPHLPAQRGPWAGAGVGQLAVELRDAYTDALVTVAYLSGESAGLHLDLRLNDDGGAAALDYFEPARVERLEKIERLVDELRCDPSDERIGEIEKAAIAEMQRARHSDADLAILDIEAGEGYRRCVQVIGEWWNNYGPTEEQYKPDEERTCHLFARICRSRNLQQTRYRRHPGVFYMHAMPKRADGMPSVGFHIQAVIDSPEPLAS